MCVVILCVGPVWGLMVGVDDDGRQRWKLSVGLFACLCGVVAMLRLCCVCECWCAVVWCDGIVCCVCVFGSWCGQSWREQDRSRGRSGDRGWAGPRAIADDIAVREDA